MVRSRRAIEGAVDKIENKTSRKLVEIMKSRSRSEFVEALSSKMKVFLAPAAHSGDAPEPPEPKNREDARLGLLLAYATVAYMGRFLSDST